MNAEAIAGLVVAVEEYVARDHDETARRWLNALEEIAGGLDTTTGLTWVIAGQTKHGIPIPCLTIALPGGAQAAARVADSLRSGDPQIWVGVDADVLVINPHAMPAEDVELVADRLSEATSRA